MQIYIRTITGKTLTINVEQKMKIENVKKLVAAKAGLPVAQQNFLFAGVQLDDNKDLEEYGIVEESMLYLVPLLEGGMQIFIKTLTGKTLAIDADLKWKVKDLKAQIHTKEGMKVEQQKLVYGGRALADEQTLQSYNITKESTLHVIFVLKGL